MKLDRLEYWLLDLVIDMRGVTLGWVADPEHGVAFNREEHGASDLELAEAFSRLYALGLIDAAVRRRVDDWRDDDPVFLDTATALAEIEDRAEGRAGTYGVAYELTALGGAAWEAAASPRWDSLVVELTGCDEDDGPDTCQIEASTAVRALEYLNYLQRDQFIDVKEYESFALTPWQATYWKRLPHGVRFEFTHWQAIEDAMRFGRHAADSTTYPITEIESEFFCATPFWYTRPWQ